MVIDPNAGGVGRNRHSAPAHETSAGKTAGTSTDPKPKTPSDSVSLSGTAQAMSRLESKIQNTPEIDQAKVEQIKQDINNGHYKTDASVIAEKMLSDF